MGKGSLAARWLASSRKSYYLKCRWAQESSFAFLFIFSLGAIGSGGPDAAQRFECTNGRACEVLLKGNGTPAAAGNTAVVPFVVESALQRDSR